MTNPDQAVLDIARDAIREGRASDVGGIIDGQPKSQLLCELLAAIGAIARSGGLNYLSMHVHSASISFSIHCADVDMFAADVIACGGEILTAPKRTETDNYECRDVFVRIAGVDVQASSHWRNLTPAEKRKRTFDAKRRTVLP